MHFLGIWRNIKNLPTLRLSSNPGLSSGWSNINLTLIHRTPSQGCPRIQGFCSSLCQASWWTAHERWGNNIVTFSKVRPCGRFSTSSLDLTEASNLAQNTISFVLVLWFLSHLNFIKPLLLLSCPLCSIVLPGVSRLTQIQFVCVNVEVLVTIFLLFLTHRLNHNNLCYIWSRKCRRVTSCTTFSRRRIVRSQCSPSFFLCTPNLPHIRSFWPCPPLDWLPWLPGLTIWFDWTPGDSCVSSRLTIGRLPGLWYVLPSTMELWASSSTWHGLSRGSNIEESKWCSPPDSESFGYTSSLWPPGLPYSHWCQERTTTTAIPTSRFLTSTIPGISKPFWTPSRQKDAGRTSMLGKRMTSGNSSLSSLLKSLLPGSMLTLRSTSIRCQNQLRFRTGSNII